MSKNNNSSKTDRVSKNKATGMPVKSVSQNKHLKEAKKEKKDYDKTITFKLDRHRFIQLKTLGLHADKSSQAILVEALDAYLAIHTEDKNHA